MDATCCMCFAGGIIAGVLLIAAAAAFAVAVSTQRVNALHDESCRDSESESIHHDQW